MQPQLSISTSFSYDLAIEDQLQLISNAGFRMISLGSNQEHFRYLDEFERERLKNSLLAHNLVIDTIHAPCRLDNPKALSLLEATVHTAADLGAGCVVVHAGPFDCLAEQAESLLPELVRVCTELAPIVMSTGITFAVENVMPGPATNLVKDILREVDGSNFGLCYDSAHDQIDGPRPIDLLDEFSDRLFAAHLSDRTAPFIDHLVPGEGFIDWKATCNKLSLADNLNSIIIEAMMSHSQFKNEAEFVEQAYKAGVGITGMIMGRGK